MILPFGTLPPVLNKGSCYIKGMLYKGDTTVASSALQTAFGFRVPSFGFRTPGFELRLPSCKYRVSGVGCRV